MIKFLLLLILISCNNKPLEDTTVSSLSGQDYDYSINKDKDVVDSDISPINNNDPSEIKVCPDNYIFVNNGSLSFCVEQDENLILLSQGSGSFPSYAKDYCKRLGDRYSMISNYQWNTIANQIKDNQINWFSHDKIYQGFTGVDSGTSFSNYNGSETIGRKNLLFLKNGEIIKNFIGGFSEWVDLYPNKDEYVSYNLEHKCLIKEYNYYLPEDDCLSNELSLKLNPNERYKYYLGQGTFIINDYDNDYDIARGGNSFDPESGLFSAQIISSNYSRETNISFRCVANPNL